MTTPSATQLTDRPIAVVCREGARVILDSWLAARLSAVGIDLLLDLASRPDHAPVTSQEALWLHAAVALLLETRRAGAAVAVAEAAQGREVAP
jgi:hypothetical protein